MKLIQRFPAALAATVLFAPALLMSAQQSDNHKPKHEVLVPRAELFFGYSYIRAVPTLASGNRLVWLNGGSTSLAYNVTRSLGLVTDFGGYNATQLNLTGPGVSPERVADAGGNAYTFLFGPRLSLRKYERFTPFAQVLGGGAYASAVTLKSCIAALCTPLPEQGSFAMTAGGGLDIKLSRHVAFRAVQAEYLMTRFANTTTNVRSVQNDIRLSSGIVFRFGGSATAAPMAMPTNHAPVAVCSADRHMVRENSGHSVMLQAQAVDADNDVLTYQWSASSGTLASSSGVNAEWNLAGVSAGAYAAKVHIEDGHGGVTDCSVNLVVEAAPIHPSLVCSAGKSPVYAGDTVPLNLQATGIDAQTLTWSTTNGHIDHSSAQAVLITSKRVTGVYTVTAHAKSPAGEDTTCQVIIEAQLSPAMIVVEKRLALHSIYFATAEPTIEHPDHGLLPSQRATLESLATDFLAYSEVVSNAKLMLIGHADPRGSAGYNEELSKRRVEASKQFLVAHGVPEASIEIKAVGEAHNLTDAEVAEAVDGNDELTSSERETLHKNMTTIILASNRRVDVTLNPAGQHSARKFPFNAKDSITLISVTKPNRSHRSATQKKAAR